MKEEARKKEVMTNMEEEAKKRMESTKDMVARWNKDDGGQSYFKGATKK
jgi:hypothetical protein